MRVSMIEYRIASVVSDAEPPSVDITRGTRCFHVSVGK